MSALRTDRRGAAALEMAAVIPVLLLLAIAVFDLGRAFEQGMRLEAAARAAGQYALSYPDDGTGIAQRVREALPGWNDVSVPPVTTSCECPGGGAVACTGTCSQPIRRFVTIRVTRPFEARLVPLPNEMSGDVTVRIQ